LSAGGVYDRKSIGVKQLRHLSWRHENEAMTLAAGLERAVEMAIAMPVTRLVEVRRKPLAYDAFLAGRSITRVTGVATVGADRIRWSLIEKVTEARGVASEYQYDNGRRELLAYRSGLLAEEVPGFAAATAYATAELEDGTLVLRLEDLAAATVEWSPETFLDAARHLGRFAGRWLGRVPEHEWLFRGWIDRHGQPQALPDGTRIVLERLADAGLGQRAVEDGGRLLADQPRFRAALDRLPQTLCHHDAVKANLFTRLRDGVPETVAIDWEMVGPGTVGADLVSLLFSSVRRGDMASSWLPDLTPQALAAYGAGMADMGAPIDAGTIRLGFSAAIALRWSLLRDVVVARTTPGAKVFRGSAMAESPETALDELIALTGFLLETAEVARTLDGETGV
jgi:hypothetical protein